MQAHSTISRFLKGSALTLLLSAPLLGQNSKLIFAPKMLTDTARSLTPASWYVIDDTTTTALFLPMSPSVFDIGADSLRWKIGWFDSLNVADGVNIGGSLTASGSGTFGGDVTVIGVLYHDSTDAPSNYWVALEDTIHFHSRVFISRTMDTPLNWGALIASDTSTNYPVNDTYVRFERNFESTDDPTTTRRPNTLEVSTRVTWDTTANIYEIGYVGAILTARTDSLIQTGLFHGDAGLMGSDNRAFHFGVDTVRRAVGSGTTVTNYRTGVISQAVGFMVEEINNDSSGVIDTTIGLLVRALTAGKVVNYAIYTDVGNNRFGDTTDVENGTLRVRDGSGNLVEIGTGATAKISIGGTNATESGGVVVYEAGDTLGVSTRGVLKLHADNNNSGGEVVAFFLRNTARAFISNNASGRPRLTVGTGVGTGAGSILFDTLIHGTTVVMDGSRNLVNIASITASGTVAPGGVTIQGALGVSAVNDTVRWTAQTASISAQNFANTTTGKLYRVHIYANTTTAGSGGTVLVTISWNDGAAKTYATATADLTSTANAGMVQDVATIYVASGTPTWATTVAGAAGSPQYSVNVTLERLW